MPEYYTGEAIKVNDSNTGANTITCQPRMYGEMQMWQNERFLEGYDRVTIVRVSDD